jgi:hypothetical protein
MDTWALTKECTSEDELKEWMKANGDRWRV